MSEDTKKEVETTVQATEEVVASPERGVETTQSLAPEIDYEAQNAALLEELTRVEQERNNYKRAALKAKGKIPQDLPEEEEEIPDLKSSIREIVKEEFIISREAQIRKQQEELIKKALRENKELKLALQAKSQVSNVSAGAAGSTMEVSDGVLSKAQIESLKAQKWSDDKIQHLKENLLKAKK